MLIVGTPSAQVSEPNSCSKETDVADRDEERNCRHVCHTEAPPFQVGREVSRPVFPWLAGEMLPPAEYGQFVGAPTGTTALEIEESDGPVGRKVCVAAVEIAVACSNLQVRFELVQSVAKRPCDTPLLITRYWTTRRGGGSEAVQDSRGVSKTRDNRRASG
jgi:hypothetical protein